MSANAKVEALKLGYAPVASLTIRQTFSPKPRQSTLDLLLAEQTVSLIFRGLRQLHVANLAPGNFCLWRILSAAQGIRDRVFNQEQGLTLDFYGADFDLPELLVSALDEDEKRQAG